MIRRNLQIDKNYILIDSYYTGGLENGGLHCANCNRIITNIAVIKDNESNVYNVGVDCAESLTNIEGLDNINAEFSEMKAIRAKINKAIKKEIPISYEIDMYGNLRITSDVFNIHKDISFSEKYLKDYLSKVKNPSKIGYKPFELENFIVPINKTSAKDYFGQKNIIKYNNFTIEVSGVYDGKNHFFSLCVKEGDEIIDTARFYMYTQIESTIRWCINTYLFNKF